MVMKNRKFIHKVHNYELHRWDFRRLFQRLR